MARFLAVFYVAWFAVVIFCLGGFTGSSLADNEAKEQKAHYEHVISNCQDLLELMRISANDFASGDAHLGDLVYKEVMEHRGDCK